MKKKLIFWEHRWLKGFNFPKLNYSCIDADFTGKGTPKNHWKNIQLYNQLSGKGRLKDPIIIYQTINPNDEVLENITKNKTENF